jgi:hypothetical protein
MPGPGEHHGIARAGAVLALPWHDLPARPGQLGSSREIGTLLTLGPLARGKL